jgi:hypothetical protein
MAHPGTTHRPQTATIQCRIEDTDVTLRGVRVIGFSSIRSDLSIQQYLTLVFFADSFEVEFFSPSRLGKTLHIVSISSDEKEMIAGVNQWAIVSIGELPPDTEDPSRLLMEISLECEIRGFFPASGH